MEFFNVISYDEALERVTKKLDYLKGSQVVALSDSLGRIAFSDIVSKDNVPSFKKSTVDGYAVKATDTHGATESVPCILKLTGKVAMGEAPSVHLENGCAVYVPTGGMLPGGADSVIPIEHVQVYETKNNTEIAVLKKLYATENTLSVGEDIEKGAVTLKKGTLISAMTIGCLAGAGIEKLEVFKDISVFVISTGDELLDTQEPISDGKIRDINSYVLSAMTSEAGWTLAGTARIKDDKILLKKTIEKGVKSADIVLISGGSSVGESDFTYDTILSFENDVFVKGIALKPGKPTICGTANGKLVCGLPGHPMAAAIVFKMLIAAAVEKLQGRARKPMYFAQTAINFASNPGRTTCIPVKCDFSGEAITARPIFGKSGLIRPLSEADGFIVIPANTEGLEKGETVAVYSLSL